MRGWWWKAALPSLLICGSAGAEAPSVTGHWSMSGELFGTRFYSRLDLDQQGDALSGSFDDAKLTGTRTGKHLHFVADMGGGELDTFDVEFSGAKLTGTVQEANSNDPDHKTRYSFTAIPVSELKAEAPKRHDFEPKVFYRQFSGLNEPVLRVNSGDTIHTTTVDAGGLDAGNNKRALGGNPQTGPFYVEQAMPGDTLAIHIIRLRLNRDSATSDNFLVPRSVERGLGTMMKDVVERDVRWHLDRERHVATLEQPEEHTAHYEVPVRPMLGCIATALAPVDGAANTGDSGEFGGNMDFNQIVEGATVYLPVSVPGALLYFGDGHALQGDGEINGNALETSLEVEVTVEVISRQETPEPRVESATRLTALSYKGSLDDAFRGATHNMAVWLTERYKLTPSEVAMVIGTAAHYEVAEVADRNAGMALSIDKDLLAKLTQ